MRTKGNKIENKQLIKLTKRKVGSLNRLKLIELLTKLVR